MIKNDLSSASIYTSFEGLAELKLAAKQDSPEALQKVAEQFEAIFLQMMLKQMREANLGEGIFDSDKTRFYQDMFDQQLALTMSEQRGIGIADSIIRQLQHLVEPEQMDPNMEMNPLPARQAFGRSQFTTANTNSMSAPAFNNPQEYIEAMRPYAEKAAAELGVPVGVLLAQSALETGWGQKIMHQQDGSNSHNLFGIKADERWSGDKVRVASLEYRDGSARKEYSDFRVYHSYEDSFNDYVEFIKSNARYQPALEGADDAHNYIRALQEAGYATDPEYADKVINIMQRQAI